MLRKFGPAICGRNGVIIIGDHPCTGGKNGLRKMDRNWASVSEEWIGLISNTNMGVLVLTVSAATFCFPPPR